MSLSCTSKRSDRLWIACSLLLLHCADIRVETGKDDASFPTVLQNARQDNVEERVHVEIGGQVSIPRPILQIHGIKNISLC